MNDELQPLTTMEKITFLRGSSFFASLPLEELYTWRYLLKKRA